MQKQEIAVSLKISNALKARLDQECQREHRGQAEMIKVLLAEALVVRDSQVKHSINQYI